MSHELVKLVDENSLVEFQKRDEFLSLLNQDPPNAWLENHPLAKNVKYLPIGMVELLLTKIFQEWRVEVLREGQLLNSIYCTVRLHYRDPITKDWSYQDGTAAVPAKTSKGAKASDMSAILSEAVMTGLPAAKSFALKDAADHIGKIFGRDINRKGNLAFVGSYMSSDVDAENFVDYNDEITKATNIEQLMALFSKMNSEEKKAFTEPLSLKKKELLNAVAK